MSHLDPLLAKQLERQLDDREVAEAQDVHLEKAELLDGVHLVLRDDVVVVGALQRRVVDERLAPDDDGGCVYTGLSAQALELARRVEHASRVSLL